ncbi:Protein required for ethanol metabolism [Ceratobasidium sp. 414]|nr:Protein required for ethanol metabolism [Ceratobasidium sp. 414]
MQAYTRFLNRRPFLGPCITTAVLFAVGDVVAQQGVDRRGLADHDWVRTARLGTYGGAVFAPIVVKCVDAFIYAALFFGSAVPDHKHAAAHARGAYFIGLCNPPPPRPPHSSKYHRAYQPPQRWLGKSQQRPERRRGSRTPGTAHSIFAFGLGARPNH